MGRIDYQKPAARYYDISNNRIVKLNKELVKEAVYGTLGMEEGNFSEPRDIGCLCIYQCCAFI